LPALGIPSEAQYLARYCECTQFCSPEALKKDWNFYMAYNLFRIAAILQGIAKRAQIGTASSAQAGSTSGGVSTLAAMAWQFAQKASH
jgi:aminoglycoside phosphotransferase (APT) family kinase protein